MKNNNSFIVLFTPHVPMFFGHNRHNFGDIELKFCIEMQNFSSISLKLCLLGHKNTGTWAHEVSYTIG